MQTSVYGLRNNIPSSPEFGELFYVGVGEKSRMLTHWKVGRKGLHGNDLVQQVFNDHITQNAVPVQEILVICPSHEYAYELEIKIIEKLGRKRLGCGVLCNYAKGGNGPDIDLMRLPEIRAKIKAASLDHWSKPQNREKHKVVMQEIAKTPEFKSAVSESTKAALNGPAIREKHLAALEVVNKNMPSKARSQSQLKSYEDNPERRIKVSVGATEVNARPGVKERKSKASTAANLSNWQDPLIRAKRMAGMQGKKKTMSAAALEARRLNAQKAKAKRLSIQGE